MPTKLKLRSNVGGISGFLDLKKSFDDAMRQMQWQKEMLAYQGGLEQQKMGVTMLDTLARYGYTKPVGIPSGTKPDVANFTTPGNVTPEQMGDVGALLASGNAGPAAIVASKKMRTPQVDKAGYNQAMADYNAQPQTLGFRLSTPQEQMGFVSKGRLEQISAANDKKVRLWLSGRDQNLAGGGKIIAPKNYEEALAGLQSIHPQASEDDLLTEYPELSKFRGAPKGRTSRTAVSTGSTGASSGDEFASMNGF